MLPFFEASGHTLYAKSSHVYLQTMLELSRSHPDLYQKFEAGFHVVLGAVTDIGLVSPQQVLMRSVKTHGGLTN